MSHSHSHIANSKSIRTAFFLNLGFTIIELIGGVLTNSVAILSDAVHDLGDSISLGLGWWLEDYSAKAADSKFSYGYSRFSLLGSLINAIVLIVGSVLVLVNTIPRLVAPEPTNSVGMIGLAIFGVIINGIAALKLSTGTNENTKVLSWHMIEDVLGWAVVLVGAILIYFTGLYIIDSLLSLGISVFIFYNVFRRLRSTFDIFMQSTPKEIELQEFKQRLLEISGVKSEHHTHSWSLDGEHNVLTTHVKTDESLTIEEIIQLKERIRKLAREFNFYHVTVEIEFDLGDCSSS